MVFTSKKAKVGGLIVLGCAMAASLATVTGVSLASAGPHDHHPAAASSREVPAALHGKRGPAVVPKVTYTGVDVNVSASAPASPGRLAARASSPERVLASFRRQTAPQGLLGPILSRRSPAISLRMVTELHPVSRDVSVGKPFPAWVVTYKTTRCQVLGLGSGSFPGCELVGIMDASTGAWVDFFQTNGHS
jgi:hypothetical protein